jgi:hypothetical protein
MPIVSNDILFKLSTTAGSSGNAGAGTPSGSLGKYISTTQITDATLNNLFDNISGDENAASGVDYRCFFVHNNNTGLVYQSVVAYISAEVSGGANIAIGADPFASTTVGSTPAQAVTIANETTAPTGVSFTSPVTKSTGISLGDINAGFCKAIWVRRTATNSSAKSNDGATITVSGDTVE